MKICYVLDFGVLKVDGPTINEMTFLKILEAQQNVEVCYFISALNLPVFKTPPPFILTFEDYQSGRIKSIFYRSLKVFCAFVVFYMKHKPDVIVTRLGPVPFLQYLISVFFGKKLFIKTMGRFWSISPPQNRLDGVYQTLINFFNTSVMKNAAGLDTVTEKFKNIFNVHYGIEKKKIAVIENGVDIHAFFPQEGEKKWHNVDLSPYFPILGYVGNLPSQRGLKQLLGIYDHIKKLYPKTAIVVVGMDDELRPTLEKLKEKAIYALGQVPYSLVPQTINLMDIGYSFTTEHDLQEVGNSSQKLRQYIACGKPVITMKSTNEFVEKNNLGSLVDQENNKEIAEETVKWTQLIEQEGDALAQRLHHYAAAHLSTEKAFHQRLEFWQSILNEQ